MSSLLCPFAFSREVAHSPSRLRRNCGMQGFLAEHEAYRRHGRTLYSSCHPFKDQRLAADLFS